MNLVAHVLLSFRDPDLIIGNWLGEAVKGKNYTNYSSQIAKGILLHREIDSFTDSHPLIRKSTVFLHTTQHKFSPIIIDLVYDYFLIKHWNNFSTEDFLSFKSKTYQLLESRIGEFPQELQQFTQMLLMYDWFQSYTTLEGLQNILTQMGRRIPYPNNMHNAIADIKQYETDLETYFLDYFPQLEKHCRKFLEE